MEDLHKAEAFFASLENRDKINVDTYIPIQNFHESHQQFGQTQIS